MTHLTEDLTFPGASLTTSGRALNEAKSREKYEKQSRTSIAYINGDTLYGSTVLFIIGGTREDKIKKIVERCIEKSEFDGYGPDDFGCDKKTDWTQVDWEDEAWYKEFLTQIFTYDISRFNTDLTNNFEIYFYISEQNENEWYKHFDYISGGREGISIEYINLDTGKVGRSDGIESCR